MKKYALLFVNQSFIVVSNEDYQAGNTQGICCETSDDYEYLSQEAESRNFDEVPYTETVIAELSGLHVINQE